jgi:peptidoglycan/xylan/chitin deacetylase (PgdA/CDA1 family)
MKNMTLSVQALRYDLPRAYARWRMGVLRDEAYTFNTTNRVLLTFDDSGTEENVRGILDVLDNEKVKAAFFLLGNWADKNPKLVQEIVDRGHWLGNHTYDHPHLPKLTPEEVRSQIKRGPKCQLFRPPYGEYDNQIRRIAQEEGYKVSFWTIDSWDWRGLSAQEMLDIILPRLHDGACILMHLNAPHTLEMLPKLIGSIREAGFELCHDGTEIKL